MIEKQGVKDEQVREDFGYMVSNVPLEIYYYFNTSPEKLSEVDREELQYIFENMKKDNIKSTLSSIQSLETKLGVPSQGETRYSKVWGKLKLKNYLNNKNYLKRS